MARPSPHPTLFNRTGHGGKRRGAGRKRSTHLPRVPHERRHRFSSARPLLVTLRFTDAVSRIGKRRLHQVVTRVLCHACDQGRFRVVHYELEQNHLHLIVEASDRAAMTRGMRVLNIRLGKQINRALGRRKGTVIADRYDEQHLLAPRRVKHALGYVLCNRRHHAWEDRRERYRRGWIDPCSSAAYFDGWRDRPPDRLPDDAPVAPAKTCLLKQLWKRHGLIPTDLIPGRSAR